jgi:hypothetical protein
MAAAVPVIGVAVGAASTVAGVAQANSQAEAQRQSIESQKQLNSIDTQMRLNEIERQKMYVNQQAQLAQASRAQDAYIQQAQIALERQALDQSRKEAELNQALQQTLISQQGGADAFRLLQQYQTEGMGRQLDVSQARMSGDLQYLSDSALNQLSTNNQLYGATAQLRGQMADIQNAEVSQMQSTNSQLQEIADAYKQASKETRAYLRQRAQNLVGLSVNGVASESDRALLASMDKDVLDAATDRILRGNQSEDIIKASEQYVRNMLGVQRQAAQTGYDVSMAGIQGESTIKQTGLDLGKDLSDTQLQLRNALAGLTAAQSYALEKLNLDSNMLLSLDLNNINTVQQLSQAGVDEQALNVLKLTQENTLRLQNEQDELNRNFSQLALTGQGQSIMQQSQAANQALNAQKSSIKSPGALGLLTAGVGAGYNIYNAVKGTQANIQPTNPFYQQPQAQAQQPLNFSYQQLPTMTQVSKAPGTYTPTNVTGTVSNVKLNLFGN